MRFTTWPCSWINLILLVVVLVLPGQVSAYRLELVDASLAGSLDTQNGVNYGGYLSQPFVLDTNGILTQSGAIVEADGYRMTDSVYINVSQTDQSFGCDVNFNLQSGGSEGEGYNRALSNTSLLFRIVPEKGDLQSVPVTVTLQARAYDLNLFNGFGGIRPLTEGPYGEPLSPESEVTFEVAPPVGSSFNLEDTSDVREISFEATIGDVFGLQTRLASYCSRGSRTGIRSSIAVALSDKCGNANCVAVLEGVVSDSSPVGALLAGAQVEVSGLSLVTTTDSSGNFRLEGIPPGDHMVLVSKDGYLDDSSPISLPPDYVATRAFQLDPVDTVLGPIKNSLGDRPHVLESDPQIVRFSANVDWNGHPPGQVIFSIDGTEDAAVSSDSQTDFVEQDYVMAGTFDPCSSLSAYAKSTEGNSVFLSDTRESDIVIMPEMPLPGINWHRQGSSSNYKYVDSGIGTNWGLLNKVLASPQSDWPPLYKDGTFAIDLQAPLANAKISRDGRFGLKLNSPTFEGLGLKMFGQEFRASAFVDLEGVFAEQDCVWHVTRGDVGLSASVSPSFAPVPLGTLGPIPVPIFAQFGGKGTIEGALRLSLDDANDWALSGTYGIGSELWGALAAGFPDIVDIKLKAEGSSDIQVELPNNTLLKNQMKVDIGLVANFAVYTWKPPTPFSWTCEYAPQNTGCSGPLLDSASVRNNAEVWPTLIDRAYLFAPDANFFTSGARSPKAAPAVAGNAILLQSSIFPDPSPDLAHTDTGAYGVWLMDDDARASIDRTQVVFSEFNGLDWSVPEVIDDDGTADFHPQIQELSDGDAIVVWEDLKRAFGMEVDFEAYLPEMEISVANYDGATGTWQVQQLTENQSLDHSPRVSGQDDDVVVVWLRHENNSLTGTSDEPATMMISRWDGLTWSDPAALEIYNDEQLPGPVLSYDFVYGQYTDGTNVNTGEPMVYQRPSGALFSIDMDGDLTTQGDTELFGLSLNVWADQTWRYWSISRNTDDEVKDLAPRLIYPDARSSSILDDGVVVTWLKDERYYVEYADIGYFCPLCSGPDAPPNSSRIQYSGRLALASVAGGSFALVSTGIGASSTSIYASLLPDDGGFFIERRWSTTFQDLLNNASAGLVEIGSPVATFANNDLLVLFSAVDAGGNTNLYYLLQSMDVTAEINSGQIVQSNVSPGETVNITLTVEGSGKISDLEVSWTAYLVSGGTRKAFLQSSFTLFGPGEQTVALSVPLPHQSLVPTGPMTIEIVLDPENTVLTNGSGRSFEFQSAYPDFEIRQMTQTQIGSTVYLTVAVANTGKNASPATRVRLSTEPFSPLPSSQSSFTEYENLSVLEIGSSVDVTFEIPLDAIGNGLFYLLVDPDRAVDELSKTTETVVWVGVGRGTTMPGDSLDVDVNGANEALTDGLLIIRHLFGLSGQVLVDGATAANCTSCSPTTIAANIEAIRSQLDVDGNAEVEALTDGLLIIRYLFGINGAALINGAIASNATRTTAEAIEAYLATLAQ